MMTFCEHHEPGNSTRYTVTAALIPESGFRGAGSIADYWIITIWPTQPTSYVLDVRADVYPHYFEQKFDSAKVLTEVDRTEYVVAINKLLRKIREWLKEEAF